MGSREVLRSRHALKDVRQLIAKQHEYRSIQRNLHRVPHNVALQPCLRRRASGEIDVLHRDSRRGRSQDSGAVNTFGREVSGEWNQQAQQYLNACIFTA
jgi:hypothetical protein